MYIEQMIEIVGELQLEHIFYFVYGYDGDYYIINDDESYTNLETLANMGYEWEYVKGV